MFKNLLIVLIAVFCYNLLDAQNVMNPNDPIVTYNSGAQSGSATNPTQPPFGVMSKWIRTVRMGWNTSAYKCYIWNGLAFRLRFPNNYNPTNATKYPIVVFFHGGGEIGPITDNEDHLLWGAQTFEQRVNNNEWNGFILYAQTQTVGFDDTYFSRINSILDTLQKYNNTDPDRAIAMGLSEGAYGSVAWTNAYPKRVAAALIASPTQVRTLDGSLSNWIHIPIWFANGGRDVNPDPYNAQAIYTDIRNAGGNVYQTYYVNDDHGTWNDMWAQKNAAGGFITDQYWNTVNKTQPLVYFQNQQFCNGAPISARMGVTAGFFAYQWSLNGSILSGGGTTGNEYTATQAGTYAVRFMRTATSGWSVWTPNPVVISTKACTADTVFSESFSQDNYYNAAAQYKIGTWSCGNGIMTSGTDVITQDATGVQGNRFLLNYTAANSGCGYAVGDLVWQRYSPGNVTPNTNYELSFYLANQNAASPAQIAPVINGVALIPSSGYVSATGVGNTSWKKFTYTWNSGSNTQAYVALTNRSAVTSGNDFAIDEISLKLAALPLPACTNNTSPLNASVLTTNATASLTWASAANATSYDVYLWTGSTAPTIPVTNIATTTYNASGLTGSTLYKWYVVPKNISGAPTGCSNNQTTFTTAVTPVPPPCVTNLLPATGSTLTTSATATLTWNGSATATSYDVYLWTGATAPVTPTATVTAATYSASGLTPATLYNWYIVPKNIAGASTGCNANFTTFTTAQVPPACVSNLLPATGSSLATSSTATLTWNAAATATSYDVYLWTGATAPSTPTVNVTSPSYSASGLTPSTQYSWYIVPKNIAGPSTGCNANFTTFTTAAVPPSCVTNLLPATGSTLTSTTTATLTWNAAATATSYDVYLWTGATAPLTPTATVTSATYSPTGLSPSSLYNWYIVPGNSAGPSTGCDANFTNFTTAALPTAPSCVTNLLPANGSTLTTSTNVTLTWNTAATATSYDVYLWTGTTAPVTPTANVTSATYSSTSLIASTLYNWYVVPKNAVGPATGCNANVTSFTTSSNTALGYIKTSVGPYQACDDNSSTGRTTVYGSTIANGTILYTNAAKTQIFNGGWQWYSYTATLGGPTIWAFAVYPTGGIFMLRNCATGTYVRVAGAGGTTVEEDIATLNRLRDSAAAADALIAASKPAVYPNPVIKGMPATLHINSVTGGTATVQVAGIAGNVIRTHQLSIVPGANLRTIQTTGLERGIYFLRIGGNTDKPATLKLVIQ
jgi:predicted esterase